MYRDQFMADDDKSLIGCTITTCKELEELLKRCLGADGRGLHHKISSVESHLPPSVVGTLRRVATIRNRLVHEPGFDRRTLPANFDELRAKAVRDLKILQRYTCVEFKCPNPECGEALRLPRGLGVIFMTCPVCRTRREYVT